MSWILLRLQPGHAEGQYDEAGQDQGNEQQVHYGSVPRAEIRTRETP